MLQLSCGEVRAASHQRLRDVWSMAAEHNKTGPVTGNGRIPRRASAGRVTNCANPMTVPGAAAATQPKPTATVSQTAWKRFVRASASHGTRPWVMAGDGVVIVATVVALGSTMVAAAGTALGFVALAEIAGLYRSRLVPSALDDAAPLAGRLIISATVVYALGQNGTGTIAAIGDDLGRVWWWSVAGSIVGVIVIRVCMHQVVRTARRREWVCHRTLVVGAGEVGAKTAEHLLQHREYGLKPIAFHDPFPSQQGDLPLPAFSSALDELITNLRVSVIILTPVSIPDSELVKLVQSRHRDNVEIYFVPSLHQLNSGAGREVERVRSIPVIRLRRSAHRSALWAVKTLLDRFLAATMLLVLTPVLLILILLVAIFIGRPVIFRQRRVGLDGRDFEMLKFRSLPVAEVGESDTAWAAETSRKPNALGRLLRGLSLDELPQLWNIWRGDMSFVGPRPERPHFVGAFSESYSHYDSRHRVRSGLTGLAQVSGLRGDTSIAERAAYDNVYIETWSLGQDAKIMLRTAGSIFRRSGG